MLGYKPVMDRNFSVNLKSAFTLIELLIVVAIIAILAAIAVPNFIEAQVRAKTSRVKSDLRAVGTALEMYILDHNRYPLYMSPWMPSPYQKLSIVTTPIAYISSIPKDVFLQGAESGLFSPPYNLPGDPNDSFLYNLGTVINGFKVGQTNTEKGRWSLTSVGPDKKLDWPYYAFDNFYIDDEEGRAGVYLTHIYDPTNGTVSGGEIFYRGGGTTKTAPGANW